MEASEVDEQQACENLFQVALGWTCDFAQGGAPEIGCPHASYVCYWVGDGVVCSTGGMAISLAGGTPFA